MTARLAFSRTKCTCTHVAFAHAPSAPSACLRVGCDCDEFVADAAPVAPARRKRAKAHHNDWGTREDDTWIDKL